MCNVLSYLCCCCPWFKKTPRSKKMKTKRKARKTINTYNWETMSKLSPEEIAEKDLTRIFKIPEQFPNLADLLKAQGLELHLHEELGKGSFGAVFKARDLNTETEIACKVIDMSEQREERIKELKNEIFIMTKGKRHENIIQIFQHFIVIDETQLERCFIFMEFANGGNLLQKLRDKETASYKRLSEERSKFYFRQICNGLVFLHRRGIAHKDIKLSNLLIVIKPDLTEVIKISDFGISRLRFDERKKIVLKEVSGNGTPELMSPQILKLYIYEQFYKKVGELREYDPFKADMWALGVCLYIMTFASVPFPRTSDTFEEFEKMYQCMTKLEHRWIYKISDNTRFTRSAACLDLIDQLIEPEVNRRLTIYLVLEHGWLRT